MLGRILKKESLVVRIANREDDSGNHRCITEVIFPHVPANRHMIAVLPPGYREFSSIHTNFEGYVHDNRCQQLR